MRAQDLQVIPRMSVIGRLANAPGRTVVTVIAPAGYGKTTLIDTWSGASEVRSVVVSLASIHDSVDAFGLHFVDTVAQQVPEVSELVELAAAPEADWPHVLLPRLVRTLAKVHVAIALDDIQVLSDAKVIDFLNTLISVQPPGVTLLLAGRSLPDVNLGKVAVEGRLAEVTSRDLELSLADLQSLRRIGLPEQDLLRIFNATGGWPAGVRMELMRREAVREVAEGHAFAGVAEAPNWALGDYLEQEVLCDLPGDRLAFLGELAVVSPLEADALGVVRVRDDTQAMVRQLRTDPVPMVRIRDTRAGSIVMMHPLLMEHLMERHPLPDERRQELLVHLATLHADAGDLDQAFEVVRRAGDVEILARFVYTKSILIILTGRTAVVRRWLGYFPDDLLRRYPQLAVTWVAINAVEGDGAAADKWLESFGLWAAEPDAVILSEENVDIGALFTEALGRQGVTDTWREAVSNETIWNSMVAILGGHKLALDGDFEAAKSALEAAIAPGVDLGLNDIWGLSALAYVYEQLGEPDRADECADRCQEILERWGLQRHVNTFSAHVSMATAALRRGHHDKARALIRSGMLKMSRTVGREDALVTAYLGLARVAADAQAFDLAARCVREADDLMVTAGSPPALVAQLSDLTTEHPALSPSVGGPGSVGLTAAELRVLQSLASLYPVPRIASELSVSPATVRTQVRAIYRKLDVNDRAAAVASARERGLIN